MHANRFGIMRTIGILHPNAMPGRNACGKVLALLYDRKLRRLSPTVVVADVGDEETVRGLVARTHSHIFGVDGIESRNVHGLRMPARKICHEESPGVSGVI